MGYAYLASCSPLAQLPSLVTPVTPATKIPARTFRTCTAASGDGASDRNRGGSPWRACRRREWLWVRPIAFLGPGLGSGSEALGTVAALSERDRSEAGAPGLRSLGGGYPQPWGGAESRCGSSAGAQIRGARGCAGGSFRGPVCSRPWDRPVPFSRETSSAK
ncbi:hypothetical protein P7K49_003447 [Saguinus oedipus]|uniref:Uncharacterized protein n=1 Tax=Saguinus oedipus TaxID=9490 RepID=A0ABQ9W4L1_SAGOE|nr:hypothetical protein P7K49_003447 [Saguinus oedipus]